MGSRLPDETSGSSLKGVFDFMPGIRRRWTLPAVARCSSGCRRARVAPAPSPICQAAEAP